MEKIEKGTIIEVEVPNVEKPIKAVVLDVIENMTSSYSACYVYILYAQKDDLQVVQLESGSFKLCKAGHDTWEDVDLGL